MKKITTALAAIVALTSAGTAQALPKSMRDYAARKLFFPSSTTAQIVVPANDTTALIIGDSVNSAVLTIDTGTGTETVKIAGTIGQDSLHVDVGTVLIDEGLVVSGTFGLTGDLTLSGGAAALTFDAANSSIVFTDDSATGLVMGSSTNPNMFQFVTTIGGEKVVVEGTTSAVAFHVDVGTVLVDESLAVTGLATVGTTLGVTGDATFGGGAGAITATAAGSSLVCLDDSATGFVAGSSTNPNMLQLVTTIGGEKVVVEGTTSAVALHVDLGTVLVDESLAVTGLATVGTTLGVTGDATFGGGAGAITATAAGSSLVCLDDSATGFVAGSSTNPNMLQLVTTIGGEKVVVEGTTAAVALHVDLGTLLVDESAAITGTLGVTDDATFGGGAGAITATAAGSSLVCLDDSATGFVAGSSTNPNMLQLVTTIGGEKVVVEGTTSAVALHVDLGTLLVDESAAITGLATVGGTLGATGLVTAGGGITSTAGVNTINDITPNATDIDFTAEHQVTFFAKVTGAVMTEADAQEDFFRIGPLGTYFDLFQDGNNTDFVGTWGDGVTGWVMPGPNAADQGFQLTEGILLGSAHSFTGQTDTMTMRVAFLISTRAELDVLQAGFRVLAAYEVGDDDTEWLAAYDDKVTVGVIDNAGGLEQNTSFATSDVTTGCTHAAAANGDILALQIEVDAAGDTTVSIGTDTPAGGTAAQIRTSVTAAYADLTSDAACNTNSITLTATEYVPTIALAKAAGGVSTTTIVDYYVGP